MDRRSFAFCRSVIFGLFSSYLNIPFFQKIRVHTNINTMAVLTTNQKYGREEVVDVDTVKTEDDVWQRHDHGQRISVFITIFICC